MNSAQYFEEWNSPKFYSKIHTLGIDYEEQSVYIV